MKILGFFGCLYGTIAISLVTFDMLFGSDYKFEIGHIFGILLHVAIVYYSWHWMKSIVILSEEDFLKKRDKEYQKASQKARQEINKFLSLLNKKETVCLIFTSIKNRKGKRISTWALVDFFDDKKEMFNVLLLKEGNKDLQEEYTRWLIKTDQIDDWQVYEDENFYGGFLLEALEEKADNTGYKIDYKSQEQIEYLKSLKENI